MRRPRADFESVLHACAVGGELVLLGSIAVAAIGAITHALAPYYGTTLRFLLALLVVTAPYAELLETRARRFRGLTNDERSGFAPPTGA